MNKKNTLLYILTLVVCFLFGLLFTLGLRMMDMRSVKPLQGGQTLAYTDFGFTMRVPETSIVRDHTEENYQGGADALYAGSITTQEDGVLYLFCYENTEHDNLAAHDERDVVAHYMSAGATQVRTREFGGRRFICYRASILGPDGEELWDTYETWDERLQITFETRMSPDNVLPILATIVFSEN